MEIGMSNKKNNLIFYYPSKKTAPSTVGYNIFESLIKQKDKLPFNIIIFAPSKYESKLNYEFNGTKIYTERTITSLPKGIVHIPLSPHLFPNSKFLLHIYSKLRHFPLVINYHGDIRTEFHYNFKSNHKIDYSLLLSYIFLPTLLKSADILVVHSYLFNNLVSDKYGVKNIKIIPNAVEKYWQSPEYKEITKNPDFLELFYHGRLSAEKGVDLLIKGFHKYISEINSKAMLYIAGDGPQKKVIEELIAAMNITDSVFLLGNLDKATIKGYLKMVDAAIYPSLWDNFPLSYIEAFSCADCPVYFSNKAGIYDFVVHDNFNLLSFNPEIDIIYGIICDISQKSSNKQLILDQKEFASKYEWDSIISEYINIYMDLFQT
jgi:glycosyltransferase involved in cell wall biosynthesis